LDTISSGSSASRRFCNPVEAGQRVHRAQRVDGLDPGFCLDVSRQSMTWLEMAAVSRGIVGIYDAATMVGRWLTGQNRTGINRETSS